MSEFCKRTDLAIEVKESFPKDHVEVAGVILREEEKENGNVKISTVEICNQQGAEKMGKPQGIYITLELTTENDMLVKKEEEIAGYLCDMLKIAIKHIVKEEDKSYHTILLSGMGNRFATPDALGPYVVEKVSMNRHLEEDKKSGEEYWYCGIAPGVMSQTGIESSEILKGIIDKIQPDALIVVDALASRSVNRLCRTIQITDAGISPGAGIGNNRSRINRESMGIPVIAIGVPTVVDAGTIIYEVLEDAFMQEGYQKQEIEQFYQSIANEKIQKLFVTPKDIDEDIRQIGRIIAHALQKFREKNTQDRK